MAFFKKQKKEKAPRILEGLDEQWLNNLPGDEYVDQNTNVAIGITMRTGTRREQQDAAAVRWINATTIVAMVCDGMGGMDGGAVASKFAITHVMDEVENLLRNEISKEMLFEIIRRVNDAIRKLQDENGLPLGCGTTMTLVIIKQNLAWWMSVGDSRIYYSSEKGLMRLTKDHNHEFMATLKSEKEMADENRIRPDALVSFLGAPILSLIDYNTVPWRLNTGDAFVLCSDGLVKSVDEQSIAEKLMGDEIDLDALVNSLADEAADNAGVRQDNTSIVIVKYKE